MPSSQQALIRRLQLITLQAQGLHARPHFGKGKEGVLQALEHLAYIQIDTLSIVERAHHHTLWARVPDYKASYIEELRNERRLFEYWFHAASYLPMKDYRYALPQMDRVRRNEWHYRHADTKIMRYVLDVIRAEGPKKSKDFESIKKKPGSWWNWKPAKLALEKLFMQGDLMIAGRDGMQKTYDLKERVLPHTVNVSEPTSMEMAHYLVNTYLRAYGFASIKQITHLKNDTSLRKNVMRIVEAMLDSGELTQLSLDNVPPFFIKTELLETNLKKQTPSIHLLSPFDNAIIHRDRLQQIFDFDFRLECYTPKEKRQYGYFCLPILYGTTFIGRVDCKAHRKESLLELIHLHIENTEVDIALWMPLFVKTLHHFAVFNQCTTLHLKKVSPTKWVKIVQAYLK